MGHEVEQAAPEFDGAVLLEPLARVWAIANQEACRAAERELGRPPRRDELEVTTWELVEHARGFDAVDLLEALDRAREREPRHRAVLRALRGVGDAHARAAAAPARSPQPLAGWRRGVVAVRLRVQPVEPDCERHRAAGDVAPAVVERRRSPGRDASSPAGSATRRRSSGWRASSRRPARGPTGDRRSTPPPDPSPRHEGAPELDGKAVPPLRLQRHPRLGTLLAEVPQRDAGECLQGGCGGHCRRPHRQGADRRRPG